MVKGVFDQIAKGLMVTGMIPLDPKRQFLTLNDMRDLGDFNQNPFYYYEWMSTRCVENGIQYFWIEVDENFSNGVLDNNFRYPPNTISNGIDYSNRYFNFVPQEMSESNNLIAKPYVIFKWLPLNTAEYLEVNDVVMGYFSNDRFIKARYKGGAVNDENSWAIITSENPLLYN